MVLYAIFVVGIVLLAAIVFEDLLGMRIVKFKGAKHSKTHRYLAFALVGIGLLHGTAAIGLLVFGWF